MVSVHKQAAGGYFVPKKRKVARISSTANGTSVGDLLDVLTPARCACVRCVQIRR